MSASTRSRVSPGRVRRSTVNLQWSGTVDSSVPPVIRDACRLPGAEEGVWPAAELLIEVVECDEVVSGGEDGVRAEVGP
jgi:hypothetical protein